MSLTYSQSFLSLNASRSSIYRKHRLNDQATTYHVAQKITFVKIKEEVNKEGGHRWHPLEFQRLDENGVSQTS